MLCVGLSLVAVQHQSKWAEAQASQKTNPKDAERERKSCVPFVHARLSARVCARLHRSRRSRIFVAVMPGPSSLYSREEELRTTAQQLLIVRRARMEKLYAQEHEAWDKELGKRGLTLEADTL